MVELPLEGGGYHLCRGKVARPGREQPNPWRQRSQVNEVRLGADPLSTDSIDSLTGGCTPSLK